MRLGDRGHRDPDTPQLRALAATRTTEYRVGCASWLDQSLLASGRFYPRRAMTAEARLRWYARFFDCVELNATYYALPSPRNAHLWAQRTPPGFLFQVKAYSLMTGHHPRLDSLPAELRAMLPEHLPLRRHGEVDRQHFPLEALDQCFELFRAGLAPLADARKLGYILFQLAPWMRYSDRGLAYLASLPRRLPGWNVAVEFRHDSWVPERATEILSFLAQHDLTFVALDCPWQPYLPAVTTPTWAVVRLHGRNLKGWLDQLAGKEPTVAEKYDYRYSGEELAEIAQRVRAYHGTVRRVSVTFNNNKDDYPIVNALDLKRLLGLAGAEPPTGGEVAGSQEGVPRA